MQGQGRTIRTPMATKLPKPKKPLLRRISTYVMLAVLGTPLVLGGTVWFLTRPERLARAVEAALGENIKGTVHIDRAHLSWRGQLMVENLQLGLANAKGPYAKVLEAPQAVITLGRRELLRLRVLVKAIEINDPVLHVVENPATDTVNLVDLGVKDTGGPRQTIPLPLFALNKGKIRFEKLSADGLSSETIAEWELSGRMTPTGIQAGTMEFHALRPDTGKNADLTGQFDLAAKTASGTITRACLRPEMALLVPREARRWWRTLSATGEVPELEAACNWKNGFHIDSAKLQVKGVTLRPNLRPMVGDLGNTLVAEMMIGAADQLWFDGIDGSAVVSDDLLRLPDLRATAHGEPLGIGTVAAKLSGQLNLTGQNEWGMAFTTDTFELADNIPILDVFKDVREIYRRFNPSGTFRISGRAESSGLNTLPELEARVELIDVKANYSVRPYPVEHLSGTLRASLNSLLIENLHGQGVAGGTVSVRGKIAPLTDDAGADITVELEDAPFGDTLLGAMGKNTAAAIRRFASVPATEALRARGLKAPEPGGTLDAVLKISRAKGPKGQWGILAEVNPVGMQLILPQWPYPLKITAGTITASETKVRGVGLKADGPSDGTLEASVSADDTNHDGDFAWQVTVEQADIPLDDWFYAALPPNAEKSARQVGVTGRVQVDGLLKETEGSKNGSGLAIALHGVVQDGQANPFGQGYVLENLAMDMTLHGDDFAINQATATHGKAQFCAKETVAWNPAFTNTLDVTAENLTFEPALANLAPKDSQAQKKVVEAFGRWKFSGNGNGHLAWNIAPNAKKPKVDDEHFTLEVDPKTLGMLSPVGAKEPLALRDMSGRVTLGAQAIALAAVHGAFDGGEMTVSGTLTPNAENFTADLAVAGQAQIKNGRLPDTVNAVLPAGVRQAVADARARGTVQIKEGSLNLGPDRTDFKALVTTDRLSFDLGLPFRHMRAAAAVHAASDKGATRTSVDLHLSACELYDRKLSDAAAKAVLEPDGSWQLPDFKATLAGGILSGSAAGTGSSWAVDADLADAALEGIKNPAGWDGITGKSGILSARVRLRNQGDGFDHLTGDGDFALSASDLGAGSNKLPVVEALNLVRPGSGPISGGKGHFIALGHSLKVDRLEMSSPGGLAIVGEGTVSLPETRLDLALATRNQRQTGWSSKVIGEVAQYVTTPFTNEMLGLRVRGTLDNPTVEMVPFADVRRALWELLPGVKKK